jgi:ppGpp synthetase/RelA/SpoT-type nucleotidyltranferase
VNSQEAKAINELVLEYKAHHWKLETFLGQLQSLLDNPKNGLASHVHSFKWRLKDPEHLREKLARKLVTAKESGKEFDITKDNLFVKVNDLVGVRILHLYTKQLIVIDRTLKELLAEVRLNIVEGPFARTWDDETKSLFTEIGIETRESGPSMYTSVHYVIDSNSKTTYTAEIQVRTLAEELWGEVTHTVDYPEPTESLACKEQIRVLARVASSCTRLVDAIFLTHEDFNARQEQVKNSGKSSTKGGSKKK